MLAKSAMHSRRNGAKVLLQMLDCAASFGSLQGAKTYPIRVCVYTYCFVCPKVTATFVKVVVKLRNIAANTASKNSSSLRRRNVPPPPPRNIFACGLKGPPTKTFHLQRNVLRRQLELRVAHTSDFAGEVAPGATAQHLKEALVSTMVDSVIPTMVRTPLRWRFTTNSACAKLAPRGQLRGVAQGWHAAYPYQVTLSYITWYVVYRTRGVKAKRGLDAPLKRPVSCAWRQTVSHGSHGIAHPLGLLILRGTIVNRTKYGS